MTSILIHSSSVQAGKPFVFGLGNGLTRGRIRCYVLCSNGPFIEPAHGIDAGRTLEQVKEGLALAKKTGADVDPARVMLRFGRLQPEAREWLEL